MIFEDKTIKYIDIVFENCDSAKVPKKYIEYITIGNINTSYSTFGNLYPKIRALYDTDFLFIGFKNLETLEYKSVFTENKKRFVLERIQRHRDITHIHFYFTDKTNLYLGVPWISAGSQYINFRQILKIKRNIYENIDEQKLIFDEDWRIAQIKNIIIYWLRYGVVVFKNTIKQKFIGWKREIIYKMEE